jgi:hypothetical protein
VEDEEGSILIGKVIAKAVQLRDKGKITQEEVSFLAYFFLFHQITQLDLMPDEVPQYESVIENLRKAGLVKTEWASHSVAFSPRQPVFRVELVEPPQGVLERIAEKFMIKFSDVLKKGK